MMKICVATATRAEYGLLLPLMKEIISLPELELVTLVTGAHLSPEFGETWKSISEDGIPVTEKVEMLLSSDSAVGTAKSLGLGISGFADAFDRIKPDLVVLLGDRYETLGLASTAILLKVPVVHLHGGEITEGAYDDSFRHAITKLSYLHFTSTEEYRRRVIQLGEGPDRVFNVGAIGLDNIRNQSLMSREELETNLGVAFKSRNYLVTCHPETLSTNSVENEMEILLNVCDRQRNSFFLFTAANADTDGRKINEILQDYCSKNPEKANFVASLGMCRYLSALSIVDAVIGNSSSAIIEAPSFKTGIINIGDRQKGRIFASSIIQADYSEDSLEKAFTVVQSDEYRKKLMNVINPYGDGKTASKIVQTILSADISTNGRKTFYDIDQELT